MEERLQKYMARCGIASRRKCEDIIQNGRVAVNNIRITELGYKICPEKDSVYVDNRLIKPEEKKVYIVLNKPEGYITSVKDEKGRKTILDLVKVNERIFPIGRLDYDSSGLLLLTNDGEIYNRIIHPRVKLEKRYVVECDGLFTSSDINTFQHGIDIGGYITAPATIKILGSRTNQKDTKIKHISKVEISIHEGKNRQIRKMCSALNHPVITLKRVSIGPLILGDLKKGHWRNLTEKELQLIHSL